jgi:predicted O-methyltransferase YrrM
MSVPFGVKNENEFSQILGCSRKAASKVAGYLTDKESYILTLLACCPTSLGTVLEIGSYKGLSTVLMGVALRSTRDPVLHACDPFNVAPIAEQRLLTDETVFREFSTNIESAGLTDQVKVHRSFSSELGKTWNQPIRFLWIDGDHSLAQTEADFEAFFPFVEPGGIIAFHDVLHHFPGPSQIFANRILLDEKWGACGFCGSIGWAQRARSPERAQQFRDLKIHLYHRLTAFACCSALGREVVGFNKLRYRLLRSLIPRGMPSFDHFATLTGYKNA